MPLVRRGLARVVGFEPIDEACDALNEEARGKHLYLPLVVGDGETAQFHICADPAMSSIFAPNEDTMTLFQTLEDATEVIEAHEVETVRLDDVEQAADADFLRVGIQGGAGAALAGAERTLRDAVAVHIRAEFVPLYVDQPLFGEVDEVLRAFGYEFHKFVGLGGRTFKPLVAGDKRERSAQPVPLGRCRLREGFRGAGGAVGGPAAQARRGPARGLPLVRPGGAGDQTLGYQDRCRLVVVLHCPADYRPTAESGVTRRVAVSAA